MKKTVLPVAVVALAIASAIGASAAKDTKKADPTIMTVNGKDIPLSEFSYLYNKNNTQQMSPTSVDEYVDMFVDYKLKVADAEAAGIDTTAAFVGEFNRYRDELAAPYLKDQSVEDSLVLEIYNHLKTNRDVNYIMMFGGRTPAEREVARARMDSIRTAIVNGNADFAEMADQFSVDKNHGHMGYMKANKYPYDFEKAVYNTAIGVVSDVQELPFGYFIVRIDDEIPDPGQVHVRHILKLTKDMSPEQKAEVKTQIDSIYNLVADGKNFATIAANESQDPGSARNGGELPWFGKGEMVPQFEAASFALADGEVSQPIETMYGYHIIQKLGSRAGRDYDEVAPEILSMIKRDTRANMATERRLEQFKKEYKAKLNSKELKSVKKIIAKCDTNTLDAYRLLTKNDKVIASVGSEKITVADVAAKLNNMQTADPETFAKEFERMANRMLDNATREYAVSQLPLKYEDYKNLINEYRDGMLLFDVSNSNVWERSTKDKAGLEAYFNTNRANYNWVKPHFKGMVVFASNDSIGDLARAALANPDNLPADNDEVIKMLRDQFGKNVKVERVLAAQGENPIIDYLAFEGEKPEKVSRQWPYFFTFRGKVIDQPEEAADVRGAVATDYQQVLEKAWLESLRAKYPVVVNRDVLRLVESQK